MSKTLSARLAGGTIAAAVLMIGVACGSATVDDRESVPNELAAVPASVSSPDVLVAAVGPSVGPLEPEIVIDITPPGLAVTSPASGSRVESASFVFQGFTEPGATVVVGHVQTIANESGRWSVELELEEGPNTAIVTTKDAAGNEFHKEVTVNFEKPLPKVEHLEPKTKPAAEPKKEEHHDFTAWTKFGICTTEPFQKTGGEGSKDTAEVLTKFKGNGIPGTLVTVTSPYGGGAAEVDDSGYWWIKVEFADGASEADFTATVNSGDHIAHFRCGAI